MAAVIMTVQGTQALSVLVQLRQPKSGSEARCFKRIMRALKASTESDASKDKKEFDVEISDADWSVVRSLLLSLYASEIKISEKFNAPEGGFNSGLGELDEIAEVRTLALKNAETERVGK